MTRALVFLALLFIPFTALAQELPVDSEAIERGKAVFMTYCLSCHGLKYYREEGAQGLKSPLDPAAAEQTFGVAPPDLSLIAMARGRGKEGSLYVYRLLTTYYVDPEGNMKNAAYAEQTEGDGTIAMPPPIPNEDPELRQKALEVSAFLLKVSDPNAETRRSIGKYVLSYMIMFTAVLYVLNRVTWKGLKK